MILEPKKTNFVTISIVSPLKKMGGEGEEKGMTEDEMVEWHHQLNGRESE